MNSGFNVRRRFELRATFDNQISQLRKQSDRLVQLGDDRRSRISHFNQSLKEFNQRITRQLVIYFRFFDACQFPQSPFDPYFQRSQELILKKEKKIYLIFFGVPYFSSYIQLSPRDFSSVHLKIQKKNTEKFTEKNTEKFFCIFFCKFFRKFFRIFFKIQKRSSCNLL